MVAGSNEGRPLGVVTGASSGIGFELARQLADHGFDVVVAAEDAELDAAAATLAGTGAGVEAVRVDLATAAGVEELAARTRAGGRPVAALVLNAGVGVSGPFVGSDLQAHLDLIGLNVTGAVRLAHRLLPDMVAAGAGRLMITSSIAAAMPGPYLSTYAASKAFLYSFAQALRVELEGTGVTVTALMPGPTETRFFERAGMEDTKLGQLDHKDHPAEVARDGFEAMMAGRDHVVAGSVTNRVQLAAARLMPDTTAASTQAKLSAPGSAR